MTHFGQTVPGTKVQLPGEPEPEYAGWLLSRLLACELDGPNAPTCRGDGNDDARERRIALAVADVVKTTIPGCPVGRITPLVVDIAQSAGLAIFYREVMKDQELPPYHPGDPFYVFPPLDVRRYAEYRARVANHNYAEGCTPDPGQAPGPPPGGYPPVPGIPEGPDPLPPDTPIQQASSGAVGVLFLLGGLALVVAGRRR